MSPDLSDRLAEILGRLCEEIDPLDRARDEGGFDISGLAARCELRADEIGPLEAALRALGFALGEDPALSAAPTERESISSAGQGVRTKSSAGGARFGRYEDAQAIAMGGMGVILRARDRDFGRSVAIKVMRAGTRASAENVSRFLREARITGLLEHPGIPPVHDIGRMDDGRWFFAMKLVSGRSLAAEIADLRDQHDRADLPAERTHLLGAFLKVCDAVAYAHSRGVIHRDLKPANVMVGEFGEVLVMDWGLAKVRGQELAIANCELQIANSGSGGELTVDGAVMGTPAYMAPEQAAGEIDKVDERSDIYALGVVLYEVLSLSTPHGGAPPIDLDAKILRGNPEPPSRRLPGARIPRELDQAVEKAMAKEPEMRYQRVEELRADVEAYLQGNTLAAAKYTPLERLAKWVRRNRAVSGVAGLALVVLAAVSIGSVWRINLEAKAARASADAELWLRVRTEERAARDRDYLSLLDLQADAERRLWPPHPEKISDYESWLDQARDHLDREEAYREEERGMPREEGIRSHADLSRFRVLARLLSGLEDLRARQMPIMEMNLETAREIGARMESAKDAWEVARTAIRASSMYGGLEIAVEQGLVPLGPDPASGLWEFAHLLTGEPPNRGADGRLENGEGTSLVLVLVPGGIFEMGSKAGKLDERPVHNVHLGPFFLSKFEMTQFQWYRITGESPSAYGPGTTAAARVHTGLHPVESVSWSRCDLVLGRIGLVLPTEAQWEFAARARTTTRWWTGDERSSFDGAANLADRTCRDHGGSPTWKYEDGMEDGWAIHAPAGTFWANAFGLHDVIGNVWEWCRDAYGSYELPARPGDGERTAPALDRRVHRGGAWNSLGYASTSASRSTERVEARLSTVGVRPARDLVQGSPSSAVTESPR